MIESNERLLVYFDSLINSIFKVLPLYEENNVGIETYIESLLFELYGLNEVIKIEDSYEYVAMLSTLESVKKEVVKLDSKKRVIKREVFKCISIVKSIMGRLEKRWLAMANYLDKYNKRLKRYGDNVGDAYSKNTISFIESTFHASPTYRVMEVQSAQRPDLKVMDGRVVEVERLGTLREIILRPTKSLEIGMSVKIDNEWFMLIDKYGGTGSTSIKMLAIKINESLKWYDKSGTYQDFMCVASATDLGSKSKQSKNEIEWNKYDVRLPIGQLFVSVEKNDITNGIGLNHRFIFGRFVYEVTGIDDITTVNDDGFGIIQYTAKITTKRDDDDFDNKIAHNTHLDDGKNDEDEGGRIWWRKEYIRCLVISLI